MEDPSKATGVDLIRVCHEREARSRRFRWAVILEFVFLEGFKRRGAATQGVVASEPVEYMDPAVVQQGGSRDRSLRRSGAAGAAFERFIRDFLNRFETVAFGALVFVERHERLLSH